MVSPAPAHTFSLLSRLSNNLSKDQAPRISLWTHKPPSNRVITHQDLWMTSVAVTKSDLTSQVNLTKTVPRCNWEVAPLWLAMSWTKLSRSTMLMDSVLSGDKTKLSNATTCCDHSFLTLTKTQVTRSYTSRATTIPRFTTLQWKHQKTPSKALMISQESSFSSSHCRSWVTTTCCEWTSSWLTTLSLIPLGILSWQEVTPSSHQLKLCV